MKKCIVASSFLFCITSLFAFTDSTLVGEQKLSEEEYVQLYMQYIDSVEQSLNFVKGEVSIRDGLAKLQVPQGFKYLNAQQSNMVLTDIWGNPPTEGKDRSLGMLFPDSTGIGLTNSYAIDITYVEDGYIDDSDAKEIDYDELLTEMKSDSEASNEQRIAMGYEPIEMVGWASPPYYDAANKKLHWAQELKFGEEEVNTLNYNIRILGRKGFLMLNAISEIGVLEKVKKDIPLILPSVEFTEGNRYADFNPDIDQVAAYGIGGLIAGKVLAKAGFFAFLAKAWKLILVGVIAAFTGLKKFLFSRKEEEETVEV